MLTKASPPISSERIIWDMIVPLAPIVGNDIDLLERYRVAGHSYVSLTIAGDDCGLAEAVHRLAGARAQIGRRRDTLSLALNVDGILAARESGKLAVGLHLEGTECLERDPDALELFYDMGIRHAILAFNLNNCAAGGCSDSGNIGLSRLGRRYLDRMRQVGMLLDVSHMSERASLEAIDHIGTAVVISHSNARALHTHYRNVTDEQAKACAASGGLVGISGSSLYIGPAPSLAEGMFRHLDYFVQQIGAEHVGLGTDYVVDTKVLARIFAERPDEWPANDDQSREEIAYLAPEGVHELIGLMEKAGYDELAIMNILGGNYIRIASAVWH